MNPMTSNKVKCPACGYMTPARGRFPTCMSCGAPLNAPAAAQPAAPVPAAPAPAYLTGEAGAQPRQPAPQPVPQPVPQAYVVPAAPAAYGAPSHAAPAAYGAPGHAAPAAYGAPSHAAPGGMPPQGAPAPAYGAPGFAPAGVPPYGAATPGGPNTRLIAIIGGGIAGVLLIAFLIGFFSGLLGGRRFETHIAGYGTYQADFPGVPIESMERLKDGSGAPYRRARVSKPSENWEIGFVDFPMSQDFDGEGALSGGVNGLARDSFGAIVYNNRVDFQGYPAREAYVKPAAGGHTYVLCFFTERRRFFVMVIESKREVSESERRRFFDSFKLLATG